MRWQVRCARNTLVAALPFQRQLRKLKRQIAGKTHTIHAQSVYSGGFDQVRLLGEASLVLQGATVLELGSGWYPVIPMMLRLAGARHVMLTDLHVLMDLETLGATTAFLRARRGDLAERLNLDEAVIDRVLNYPADATCDEALEALGLSYHVPFHPTDRSVKVDAVVSHTVLEHIPPEALSRIFCQSRALLKPGGVISHGIDHSDHRAHNDPTLDRIDFLRYGEGAWRMLCLNPQDYTNRLRHSDYKDMIDQAGFEIIVDRPIIDHPSREHLPSLPLAPRFRDYEADDLATTWSHIVARSRG